MITNQDTISDHMNADLIRKTLIARRIDQNHENKNNPKFTSNQFRKYTITIPTNNRKHRNNRVIHSPFMIDIKSENQD